MRLFTGSIVSRYVFLFLFLLAGCNSNPQNTVVLDSQGPEQTLILAPEDEPGERLLLNVSVIDKMSGTALEKAEIYFYQADTHGEYNPADPSDESTSRLNGKIITDSTGNFMLSTILPGEYEEPGNRHIHIHYARAEGYKQTGGVILFDHNVNDEVREWAEETGFGIIVKVEKIHGNYYGEVKIKLNSQN